MDVCPWKSFLPEKAKAIEEASKTLIPCFLFYQQLSLIFIAVKNGGAHLLKLNEEVLYEIFDVGFEGEDNLGLIVLSFNRVHIFDGYFFGGNRLFCGLTLLGVMGKGRHGTGVRTYFFFMTHYLNLYNQN